MIRLKIAILAALLVGLFCAPLPAQKPNDEAPWTALNKELDRAYENKNWPGAILAEIKAKYGSGALVWDRSQPAPPFPVQFDDSQIPQSLEMRREFAIDAVVAGAKDDYERLRRLARWVSTRWKHSSDQMALKSDPLTILREAKKGDRFICREYAVVMAGVAAAYGMPSRVINLLPRDVETRSEAHSVAEVWLESFKKRVLAVGQFGAIAGF